MKYLLGMRQKAWLDFLGISSSDVELLDEDVDKVDTDLSTVTAAADLILRVRGDAPCIAHIEFQASADRRVDSRVLRYNVLLGHEHDLPVESTLVMLRKEADVPGVTGRVIRRRQNGRGYLDFVYAIVRVWERPVDEFLNSAPNLLPLAPLAAVNPAELPSVFRRMDSRIAAEVAAADAKELWTSVFVLMGLRYDRGLAEKLVQGVQGMKESVTYQWIVEQGIQEGLEKGMEEGLEKGREKGELQEARKLLLRLGRRRLGEPGAGIIETMQSIESLQSLEDLTERILDVETWSDLFASFS
jgi:hypothetical protein